MASKLKNTLKGFKLVLVGMLALTAPLQAVVVSASAATTAASATSSGSSATNSSSVKSSNSKSSNSSSSDSSSTKLNDSEIKDSAIKRATSASASSSSRPVAKRATARSAVAASDESIDSWMPDKNLQQLIFNLFSVNDTHFNYASNDHGSYGITSVDQITKDMLLDLKYLTPSKPADVALAAKVTDLSGLQYATNLVQVNLYATIIKTAPGDWSVFANTNMIVAHLGTIDASSSSIDLKDLAKLPPYKKVGDNNTGTEYTLKNGEKIGMPNRATNGTATQVTELTDGQTMSYNSDRSTMQAYIPLSDWYKGFMTTSGDYKYYNVTTDLGALPAGVTLDMTNHRFVVDLNTWSNQELKIPSFGIKDYFPNDQIDPDENGVRQALYYTEGNTLDATVPTVVPTPMTQKVDMTDPSKPTVAVDTSKFGFGTTGTANVTINSGGDDIKFDSSELADNKINFTVTASGLQKLTEGDLPVVMTIADGNTIVKLTLTIDEPEDSWMPDATLRTELQADLTSAGLGTLTKASLAKLTQAENISGVSNLTGLEYATGLTALKMTNCSLNSLVTGDTANTLKATNSKALSQLTELEKLEIDNSGLGGSLADWGLSSLTKLTSLIANNDQLTASGAMDYAKATNLSVLNLSDNLLTGDISQFPVADWPQLTSLQLGKDANWSQTGTNQLTGSIPTDWSKLSQLGTLNLMGNKLTGTLDNIAQLANLTEIHLDDNSFTGTLPAAWFTTKLTYFSANNNQLSGDLPATLSKTTNLTWLDVQNNQLTGALPDLTNDKQLKTLAYSTNHITSGSAASGAKGTYQTWSIADPDWQTSWDGRKMTLDLSKYYGGEQGQTDYRYTGISLQSGGDGVTLNKADPKHPLLTVDTTKSPTINDGNLIINLVDQAGKQAVFDTEMNYLATIDIPITLAIPKTYEIDTNDVDFGSHLVGAGTVNAPQKAFNLAMHSTNAQGDSYQLTAQTTGLTANGHTLPLYYYNGQRSLLLNNVAQAIYDYQPTTADDTTVVGDSSDATKGNLRTDVPGTTFAGDYTGQITYTLASAPANATPADSSDAGKLTAATVNQTSPTMSAANLPVAQTAVLTKLQTNMTSFVKNQLTDSDGVLYASYKAAQTAGTQKELTETNGMWLLALAMSGDEATFNSAFKGIVSRFYDADTQIFNWQVTGSDHQATDGSASVDDLRIIQALMVMNQKNPDNERTAWLNKLIDGFTKHDLNAYYQMIDGYSAKSGQEKQIRLDYLDLATLKAVYQAKGLGTAGDTAYNQQLKLIKDSYISDKLPLFATYYNYSTGNYQVAGDTAGQVNITDGLLTMLNLAKVGELPATSLAWLKAHTANKTIYNNYNITDGTPVDTNSAVSSYAYVAQIAVALGDATLYNQALTVLKSMTSDDDNQNSPLTASDPLYGSAQYEGESDAFNDLNMLLAYNSVFAATK